MNPGTVLMERIADALNTNQVAVAAGLTLAVWADTARPRVFRGLAGFLGGRNRGRLPFLEYDLQTQAFDSQSVSGGTIGQVLIVRAHVGSKSQETAGDLTLEILTAALAAIRSENLDNLCAFGNDAVATLLPSPWGLQRDASITVEQSFSRETYEAT